MQLRVSIEAIESFKSLHSPENTTKNRSKISKSFSSIRTHWRENDAKSPSTLHTQDETTQKRESNFNQIVSYTLQAGSKIPFLRESKVSMHIILLQSSAEYTASCDIIMRYFNEPMSIRAANPKIKSKEHHISHGEYNEGDHKKLFMINIKEENLYFMA
jgi:hypothetical protein